MHTYMIWNFAENKAMAQKFLIDMEVKYIGAFENSRFYNFPSFPRSVAERAEAARARHEHAAWEVPRPRHDLEAVHEERRLPRLRERRDRRGVRHVPDPADVRRGGAARRDAAERGAGTTTPGSARSSPSGGGEERSSARRGGPPPLARRSASVSSAGGTGWRSSSLPGRRCRRTLFKIRVRAAGVNPVDWKLREGRSSRASPTSSRSSRAGTRRASSRRSAPGSSSSRPVTRCSRTAVSRSSARAQ